MRRFRRKLFVSIIAAAVGLTFIGCQGPSKPSKEKNKIMLFNGEDLTGWWLFSPNKNSDVQDIWTVKDRVIYCQGKPNGYIRTEAMYENYHLHLEWRWPEEPTNSGVLLHTSGPDKVWPRAIECQLKADNAGDFVLMNGTGITVNSENKQNPEQQYVVIPKKEESSEKVVGQWNSYDIFCDADTIRCLVNDVLQNEGIAATDTSGGICLQSEGGPIEFRNIYIEPLNP